MLEGGGCCSIYSVPVIFISLTTNLIQIFRSDRSLNVFNLVPMLFPPQEGRAWERGCLIPTACLFAGLGWTVYMLWVRDWNVLRAIKKFDHYIESCNIYRTKTSCDQNVVDLYIPVCSAYMQLFQLRLSPNKAKKSNTSAKGLLGIAKNSLIFSD